MIWESQLWFSRSYRKCQNYSKISNMCDNLCIFPGDSTTQSWLVVHFARSAWWYRQMEPEQPTGLSPLWWLPMYPVWCKWNKNIGTYWDIWGYFDGMSVGTLHFGNLPKALEPIRLHTVCLHSKSIEKMIKKMDNPSNMAENTTLVAQK